MKESIEYVGQRKEKTTLGRAKRQAFISEALTGSFKFLKDEQAFDERKAGPRRRFQAEGTAYAKG